MTNVTEDRNPPKASVVPYFVTVALISVIAIVGVVIVLVLRPNEDNAGLITQIFGFATMTTMGVFTFMRSGETREIVNSRMDEFKRTLQLASDVAQAKARADGREEGRHIANIRTDALAEATRRDKE